MKGSISDIMRLRLRRGEERGERREERGKRREERGEGKRSGEECRGMERNGE